MGNKKSKRTRAKVRNQIEGYLYFNPLAAKRLNEAVRKRKLNPDCIAACPLGIISNHESENPDENIRNMRMALFGEDGMHDIEFIWSDNHKLCYKDCNMILDNIENI